jgi:hypothetical protein
VVKQLDGKLINFVGYEFDIVQGQDGKEISVPSWEPYNCELRVQGLCYVVSILYTLQYLSISGSLVGVVDKSVLCQSFFLSSLS